MRLVRALVPNDRRAEVDGEYSEFVNRIAAEIGREVSVHVELDDRLVSSWDTVAVPVGLST